ncbi:hypothetical protein SSBR45G_52260 [Bradyrhizobium sp. SSBR45G]|nr:hypothetical protein SSBR45G_52260 [Bradyrhizobium sp. SSBR45G]GLH87811.1 hypothetical protein SSBR45R_52710 [Bradyrhizobium sp. SSBR45R]
METKAAFVDMHVGPDALDQLALVHDLAGPLGKDDEDVEGATADMKRRAILLQEPGLG